MERLYGIHLPIHEWLIFLINVLHVSQADHFFQAKCCLLELLCVLPLLKQWPFQKGHSNNSRNRLIGCRIHAW